MASKNPQDRSTIARIAASARWGKESPELDLARRDFAAESLAAHVRRVVDSAPPLTAEQRDVILAAFAGFAPASNGGASA